MKIPPFIAARVKAVAALIGAGIASYVADAVIQGQVLTLHGLELAVATALVAAGVVHGAPANKGKASARSTGSPLTFAVHADTAPALAALKELRAEAERTAKAVNAVKPHGKRVRAL